jgi:hypothetical protein
MIVRESAYGIKALIAAIGVNDFHQSGDNDLGMKSHQALVCSRCGKAGRPRQLSELLKFDKAEPVIVLCGGRERASANGQTPRSTRPSRTDALDLQSVARGIQQ